MPLKCSNTQRPLKIIEHFLEKTNLVCVNVFSGSLELKGEGRRAGTFYLERHTLLVLRLFVTFVDIKKSKE